jgi:hypothetical protein
MDDVHETLIGIESELHNMNLNIIELIKTIKEASTPKVEKPDIPYDPSIDPFAM